MKQLEQAIKKRVEIKAQIFGQDITINDPETGADPSYKINPTLVAKLYGEIIMPLTKEVQIECLLRRLDRCCYHNVCIFWSLTL